MTLRENDEKRARRGPRTSSRSVGVDGDGPVSDAARLKISRQISSGRSSESRDELSADGRYVETGAGTLTVADVESGGRRRLRVLEVDSEKVFLKLKHLGRHDCCCRCCCWRCSRWTSRSQPAPISRRRPLVLLPLPLHFFCSCPFRLI